MNVSYRGRFLLTWCFSYFYLFSSCNSPWFSIKTWWRYMSRSSWRRI